MEAEVRLRLLIKLLAGYLLALLDSVPRLGSLTSFELEKILPLFYGRRLSQCVFGKQSLLAALDFSGVLAALVSPTYCSGEVLLTLIRLGKELTCITSLWGLPLLDRLVDEFMTAFLFLHKSQT